MSHLNQKITESALVSCTWVYQNFDAENQLILDATFFLPRQLRNAEEEYQRQHIPGALFFNIDKVADLTSQLDHMLPTAEYFAEAVGNMGVSNDTLVLIYDNNHFFATARVWWMFRVFGHDLVRIIDGGMARWRQLNFPVNSYQSNQVEKIFRATFRPELVFDLEQMRIVQKNKSWQIIDARSPDSFLGLRKHVEITPQLGHILGSINIPYAGLTNSEEQTLLTNQSLQLLFDAAHIDLSKPIVSTCGSGVSAAVLALALYQLGLQDLPIYDGSWVEWEMQS